MSNSFLIKKKQKKTPLKLINLQSLNANLNYLNEYIFTNYFYHSANNNSLQQKSDIMSWKQTR